MRKILDKINKYKYIIVITVLLGAVYVLYQRLVIPVDVTTVPETKYKVVDNPPPVYNSIEPGETSYENLNKTSYGELIEKSTFEDKVYYSYRGDYKDHQFWADKGSDEIRMTRVLLPNSERRSLADIERELELPAPSIVGYDRFGWYDLAHVYPEQGIVLSAFENGLLVDMVSYFEPMTKEEFEDEWGFIISDKPFDESKHPY